ncbi:hypothetical protein BGZ83_002212 [Gryganskiella cystojenkinii]|nr:hypothetical protein BGZ83_002212 [Gryganskiella cystojenkinii]
MQQKTNRISIAKAILLVSVSFMMLAVLHVSYTNKYSYYGKEQSTTDTTTTTSPSTSSSLQNGEPPYVPPSKKHPDPSHNDEEKKEPNITSPGKVESPTPPSPAPETPPTTEPPKKVEEEEQNNRGVVLSDTTLTTTLRFENGTQHKTFKPSFFKHPVEAKKEMGSIMQTLATRSWWVSELLENEGENFEESDKSNDDKNNDSEEDDEEEEDDERDKKDGVSTMTSGRFFTYLPMGGGNNQFTSLQKAALLAKDLKRTLIMPPISPNSHIKTWAGPRYSQFYDLDTFMTKSGIPVIEWHDVKQTPENVPGDFNRHWADFSEDFPCTPNGNIGVNDHSLYDKFRPQFLLKYRPVFSPADTTQGKSTDFKYARDVLLKDEDPIKNTPAVAGEADPNMWKCLSCPYFLGGPNVSDRTWAEVGLHLRFNDKTEAMVDDILDTLLGPKINDDGSVVPVSKETFRPHPEFIVIHLRRGDIVSKCPAGKSEVECVVQIEAIAKKVDEIEKQRRVKFQDQNRLSHYKALPVLVTTNEQRESELEKLYALGWILLDHGDVEKDPKTGAVKEGKTKKLGTESRMGPWYPSMLDAVLLTRGDYLIGMSVSRMSILATQRGKAWHNHITMLM